MSMLDSGWIAAHGKLWYDDKPYRFAWIVWPQALAAALVLWFWFAPELGYLAVRVEQRKDGEITFNMVLTSPGSPAAS